MKRVRAIGVVPVIFAGLLSAGAVLAQDSADALLEKARAEAAEIEKLKKIINEEPDQNVRLAAFNLMTKQGSGTTYEIAVDAGLASADKLLQAAAFKQAVMKLNRLHLTLTVDTDASNTIQKDSQNYLDSDGNQIIIPLDGKNSETGTFKSTYWSGQVTGTHLSFKFTNAYSGTLTLKDDDAVSGPIVMKEKRKTLRYIATGKIR